MVTSCGVWAHNYQAAVWISPRVICKQIARKVYIQL